MNILKYSTHNDLNDIIEHLNNGKIIVYPTDTIYGIGANINNQNAIKNVFISKNRPFTKALSVCFHDYNQLKDYVVLDKNRSNIIKKLLPGPYTLLLNKKSKVNPLITANSNIIGVRIPDNEICFKLTRDFPITTTSANVTNKSTPDNIEEIKKQLNNKIHTYIDVGKLEKNKASTIIDLTQNKPKIIREGIYNKNLLYEILKINL